jgi:phage gp36-like protein
MPHHGEGPYVTGDYTSAEITERMLRRKINRLEKEKAELEMYLNSLPAKHRIDRLEREKAELVEALEDIKESFHRRHTHPAEHMIKVYNKVCAALARKENKQ